MGGEAGSKQLIAQVGTLAVVVAFAVAGAWRMGRKIFLFINNEGARASFVVMTAKNQHVRLLLLQALRIMNMFPCLPWYARVPTACNPADAPSREDLHELHDHPDARRMRLGQDAIARLARAGWEGGRPS